MLRVFLVEDESIIRETLRDTVPWSGCGYTFVGEAADGEMAMPLIRKHRPDVLITDIRMPFMDGLALSKLVLQEFPEMKIVIISGYDDFEYAQQAIGLGVEQYLLKPITKSALVDVLRQISSKIETQRAHRNYQERFLLDSQEYEQYARRKFMEKLVSGGLSVQQIYEEAGALQLDLRAQCYCLVFLSILPGEGYSESDARLRESLLEYFLRHPEYLLLRWNLTTYMVLVMGENEKMEGFIQRCLTAVQGRYDSSDQRWHIAVSAPTQRLSSLPECYEEVSRLWAYRYLLPEQHILTAQTVGNLVSRGEDNGLSGVNVEKISPAILTGVMRDASMEEIPNFVEQFLLGIREMLSSMPFCQYLMLSARFTAIEYCAGLGISQQRLFEGSSGQNMIGQIVSEAELQQYLSELFMQVVRLREQASSSQYRDLLRQAVAYIDGHFCDEKLSLNQVAQAVNISANYLSAVFSQEMGCTFIEYVTSKRMAKAKELLRTTDRRSGEVALAVGYKDPHYFSFLFKKTQGCTPRDYRGGGRK